MPFLCNICAEESIRICARCTKDTCNNHLCEKCLRCSDCCECEVMLADNPPAVRTVLPKHEPPPVQAMAAEEPLNTGEPPAAEEPPPAKTVHPSEPAF